MDSLRVKMHFKSLHQIRSARPAVVRSARPTAAYIARLTATATFAYLLALLIPAGTSRPVLAPLTALLVLQASLYQTIRSGIKKVLSVTIGVLGAVGVAQFVTFSWWQLGLLIAGALLIGSVLRLGDDLLEVPISAMLIFSSVGTHVAATGRIVDTLVGTAAGLAGGLIFAGRPRVQPAKSAVGQLAGQVAGLMDDIAAGLRRDDLDDEELAGVAREWLLRARALRNEIERVDDALREAAETTRLTPHAIVAPADAAAATETTVALRGGLEALERAALSLRFLVRSVVDSAGIASEASPVRDHMTRVRLGGVLAKLGSAVRIYGQMVEQAPLGSESLESALTAQFEQAHELQDELADVLKPRVGDGGEPSEWPLRGEILTHVDRLRTMLSVEAVDALARVQRSARERRRAQARMRRQARAGVNARAAFRPSRTRPPGQDQPVRAGSRSRSSAHSAR